MTEALVTYEARDGVGWITLNRPNVLNALSTELAAALADHAATAATDARVAQVVVRGAGRAFCSGMDRTALAAGSIGEAFYRHWNPDLDRALATVIGKARGASPTATAHTKRLLHDSFHRDPRGLIEEVLRAQRECVASWEMDESNRAWKEKREARFYPPAGLPS